MERRARKRASEREREREREGGGKDEKREIVIPLFISPLHISLIHFSPYFPFHPSPFSTQPE
jgi:hypothetical protein